MKKIIFLLLVPIFTNAQKADSTKLIQKVSGGVIFSTVASTTFSGSGTPFTLGHNLVVNVSVMTPKTFHNVMYGFGNNTIQTINGYFLPKNYDIYVLYIRGLSTKGNYLALGFEKMVKIESVKFFLFSEVGTNLKGTQSFSIGLLTNVQFWKIK